MHPSRLFCCLLATACWSFAQEKPPEPEPKTRAEAFERAGVKLTAGPTTVPLGKVAELKLPAGYHFVGAASLDKFYELTQNVRSGNEVGVLIAPADWMLFFDHDAIGYVKDDDKDKLDADKLLATMTEGQEAANVDRKGRGWDEMRLAGWAAAPHYDPKSNHLKWALNLSSSHDNFKEVWINESIRLLGRAGVMNVTLVTDPAGFKAAEAEVDRLLASQFSYVAGERYSEFKSGDKVAAYGLSALVLGGAGAVAAKAGLFAKLGILLGKFWKVIAVALVALVTAGARIWNRITGRRPPDSI